MEMAGELEDVPDNAAQRRTQRGNVGHIAVKSVSLQLYTQ